MRRTLDVPSNKAVLGAVPQLVSVLVYQRLLPGIVSERILPTVSHADRIPGHRHLLDRERHRIAAVPFGHDRQHHRSFYIFVGRWLWRVRPVGRHNKSPKDNEPRQSPYRQGDTECYVFHVDFELVQTAMFGANIISVAPSWTQSSVTSTAARAAPEKLESKSLCSNKRINGLCAPVDFCSSFSWRRPSCEPSSSTFPMTPSQPCILC